MNCTRPSDQQQQQQQTRFKVRLSFKNNNNSVQQQHTESATHSQHLQTSFDANLQAAHYANLVDGDASFLLNQATGYNSSNTSTKSVSAHLIESVCLESVGVLTIFWKGTFNQSGEIAGPTPSHQRVRQGNETEEWVGEQASP